MYILHYSGTLQRPAGDPYIQIAINIQVNQINLMLVPLYQSTHIYTSQQKQSWFFFSKQIKSWTYYESACQTSQVA